MSAGTQVRGQLLTPYACAYETSAEPGSPEWLEDRRSGIGGADIPAIMGEDPYKDSFQLYLEKRGDPYVRTMEAARPFSEAAHFGHLLEPVVVAEMMRRVTEATGKAYWIGTLPMLQDTRCTYRRANLDAVLRDADAALDAWPDALAEVKTAGLHAMADWRAGVPIRALLQTQYYLMVTGIPVAYVGCLVAGQRLFWHEVRPDVDMAEAISTAVAEFWERVQIGFPPLPSGIASTTRVLRDMYPVADEGSTVELSTSEDAELLADYRAAYKAEKDASADVAKLANRLRQRLGDAEAGTVNGRTVVRYPSKTSTVFQTSAFKEAHPDLYDLYTASSSYRSLTVKT